MHSYHTTELDTQVWYTHLWC